MKSLLNLLLLAIFAVLSAGQISVEDAVEKEIEVIEIKK